MVRRVCFVTGTRAEYGLLRPLMKRVEQCPFLQLQIVVTGSHLSGDHGMTISEVEGDDLPVSWRVSSVAVGDDQIDIARSFARTVEGTAEAISALKPDLMILLGDRHECLAAGIAAMISRTPIAHIHGGESTGGLIDDACRHSLTKMAHLHFVSAPEHRDRVIQLGESPDRIWCTGAIGLDSIKERDLLSRRALERAINASLGRKNAVVTFHPVTLQPGQAMTQVEELIQALEQLYDYTVFVTLPNIEAEASTVRQLLECFSSRNRHRAHAYASLGQLNYLSLMNLSDVVIGNSSSGLIEAPALGIPTVNVGVRQLGRLRGPSVIDVEVKAQAILRAVREIESWTRPKGGGAFPSPYGQPGACDKIMKVLVDHNLDDLLIKNFETLGDARQ